MHKRNFSLTSGSCLNDDRYSILTFDVRAEDDGSDDISILLPEPEDLASVIGTSKWMVKSDTAKALDGGEQDIGGVMIVGPNGDAEAAGDGGGCAIASACGGKLGW